MSGGTGLSIFLLGSLLGAVNLGVAFWAFQQSEAPATIIIMTSVVILQIVEAHVLRSNSRSVFLMNPLSNKPLLAATLVVMVLQALVLTLPPVRNIFKTGVMSPELMIVPLIAGGVVLVILEAKKLIFKRKRKKTIKGWIAIRLFERIIRKYELFKKSRKQAALHPINLISANFMISPGDESNGRTLPARPVDALLASRMALPTFQPGSNLSMTAW